MSALEQSVQKFLGYSNPLSIALQLYNERWRTGSKLEKIAGYYKQGPYYTLIKGEYTRAVSKEVYRLVKNLEQAKSIKESS